jgi:phospholipid/cholesterol/gamma-HCH transport system permease protein
MPDAATPAQDPQLKVSTDGTGLHLCFSGDWLLGNALPDLQPALQALRSQSDLRVVQYAGAELGRWDTGLIAPLARLHRAALEAGLQTDSEQLPDGVRRLLQLAFAVKERDGARRTPQEPNIAAATGMATLEIAATLADLLRFVGEVLLAVARVARGTATFRWQNVWVAVQEAGAEALPIVGLISLLIGMIFAFVGVVQLTDFGAGIYTADLVAVALVREMAPIMTGIIMAGRTGAAYAAQLGTMKVNEEIDALTTLGVSPIDYLVVPRFFALIVMMPFLTMYASLLGIVGGAGVAVSMLDVTLVQYAVQTSQAVTLSTLFGGLFKSLVYGAMVALTGTQQGIACGSSAMAVGQATTRAVVMGIVLIVVSAAILTVIYINLDI